MKDDYLHTLQAFQDQYKAVHKRLLITFLELKVACIHGVTAAEAVEWLEMPKGRSSETMVGIMLKELGYCMYRKHGPEGRRRRLFPVGRQPEGWSL